MRVFTKKEVLYIDDMIEFVRENIKVGATILAPKDMYNYTIRQTEKTERVVIGFYPYFVITMDTFGKLETYTYYDMDCLIKFETIPSENE